MKLRSLITFFLAITLLSTLSHGAVIVSLTWDSGSYTLKQNNGTTNITGGTGNHNGAVLQLGYFTSATSGNLFNGSFVPLTGEGSLNTTFANTRVGDFPANGASDGSFAFSSGVGATSAAAYILSGGNPNPGTTFTVGEAGASSSFPLANAFLAIRFYDNTTIATSTYYETVANVLWKWVTPNDPAPAPVALSFDDAGIKVQSTGTTPISPTTIKVAIPTVPEPTSAALLMVGLVSFAARRRRQVK